ncbi:hypothetical protein GOBAR_AA15123 [Gossypium barbadense]|uniref:Uncharacterized protein n=1 Tax=Gossypium barbadense TaxID=3634 RepID=A0A2P5XQB8_GOSBA|nr:hypothetical protein GOBAR_AA15123 [Gossypium barbadense]
MGVSNACAKLTSSPAVVSLARVTLAGLPTATSHGRGNFIESRDGEKFCPIFTWPCCILWYVHGLRHAHVPGRVVLEILCSVTERREEFTLLIPTINFINRRFKTSIVYLKCAEFGMNYLDCTIWENNEYSKRNFFIRFRSGNARIYCI